MGKDVDLFAGAGVPEPDVAVVTAGGEHLPAVVRPRHPAHRPHRRSVTLQRPQQPSTDGVPDPDRMVVAGRGQQQPGILVDGKCQRCDPPGVAVEFRQRSPLPPPLPFRTRAGVRIPVRRRPARRGPQADRPVEPAAREHRLPVGRGPESECQHPVVVADEQLTRPAGPPSPLRRCSRQQVLRVDGGAVAPVREQPRAVRLPHGGDRSQRAAKRPALE